MNAEASELPCIEFAAHLASLSKSALTGVFVRNTIYEDVPAIKTIGGTAYVEDITDDMLETEEDRNRLAHNVALFEDSCKKQGVDHSVRVNKGIALYEIIRESRYADFILTDAAISFLKDTTETIPSAFLKSFLPHSECPVLVLPEKFASISEIVFSYDGSKSSVFAIKQFIYLFSALNNIKTTILEIKTTEDENVITEVALLEELLRFHYKEVQYRLVHGENPKKELFKLFLGAPQKLLVMGAYGTHKWFGSSTAELVLKTANMPVFISHQF